MSAPVCLEGGRPRCGGHHGGGGEAEATSSDGGRGRGSNLVVSRIAQIPYHELAIVADGTEERGLLQVELNVLDDVGVPRVRGLRLEGRRRLRACATVAGSRAGRAWTPTLGQHAARKTVHAYAAHMLVSATRVMAWREAAQPPLPLAPSHTAATVPADLRHPWRRDAVA